MNAKEKSVGFLSKENILGFCVGTLIVGMLVIVMPSLKHAQDGDVKRKTRDVIDSQPLVAFEPPDFNYGTVLQAQIVEHTFRLVNRSTNEMRIVAMRASCSCTLLQTNLLGTILPPNGAVILPVRYDSGPRDGSSSSTIDVALQANGIRYVAEATLRVEVQADFTFEPKAIEFRTLRPGQSTNQTVVFLSKAMTGFPLIETQAWVGPFEILVTNATSAASSNAMSIASIAFHAPTTSQRAAFTHAVQLATMSKRVPAVMLPLSGQVVPDAEVSPEVLVLTENGLYDESRLTVLTRKPSRITRVLSIVGTEKSELQTINGDLIKDSGGWTACHTFRVMNSALAGAEKVDVELEIRQGPDQNEALSVSIQVRSLTQKQKKQ